MKKTISLLILFSLLTITLTPIGQVQAARRIFEDIDNYQWANQDIEKMFLLKVMTGRSSTFFAPGEPVTQLEAIVTFVRLLGYEEYSKTKDIPESIAALLSVPQWGRRYVAVAMEIGLLPPDEFLNFKPNQPALRHQVAVMAVRAMGLDERAKSMRNIDLDIIGFNDLVKIPMASRTYVQVAVEEKIIQGMTGNIFAPMENINRASMVVIANRIHKRGLPYQDHEMTGTVVHLDIDGIPSITFLDSNNIERYVAIDNNTSIYKNNKPINLRDLPGIEYVYVIADYENKNVARYIEYLESLPDNDENFINPNQKIISGRYKDITNLTLTLIDSNNNEVTYNLIDDYVIEINGKVASLNEMVEDMEIRFLLDEDQNVTKLWATGKYQEIEGKVLEAGDSIKLAEGTFNNTPYTRVTKNWMDAKFNMIAVGDIVKAKVQDDKVIEIFAYSPFYIFAGRLIEADQENLTIIINDGVDMKFQLSPSVNITRQEKKITLDGISKYDRLTVYLVEGKVSEILAQPRFWHKEGTVMEIRKAANNVLKLQMDQDEIEEFIVRNDVKIIKDGKEITLFDINIGEQVICRMLSDVITSIEVLRDPIDKQFEGKIKSFNNATNRLTLIINQKDMNINIDNNTIIIHQGKIVGKETLTKDDVIVVFAKELHDKSLKVQTIVIKEKAK